MTTPAPVREAILARCASGMSYRAISREVAASYATVKRIGNAAGHRRPVGRPRSAEEHSAGILAGPSTPIGALRASYGPQERAPCP